MSQEIDDPWLKCKRKPSKDYKIISTHVSWMIVRLNTPSSWNRREKELSNFSGSKEPGKNRIQFIYKELKHETEDKA